MLDLPECEPPRCLVVIEAPAPGQAAEPLPELLQPLEETMASVAAATGLGLEPQPDESELRGVRRRSLPVGPPVDGRLSFLAAGDPSGRRVLFIHGSPSDATEWGALLAQVPPGFEYVAVDRPGFGESDPPEGLTALADQAAALAPLLEVRDGRRPILVGYSYGAPVAVRAALDYPERVGGLLLIGAALDPALEDVHPLQRLAALEMVSPLLPRHLEIANRELLALEDELRAMAPRLAGIAVPIVAVHGLVDALVPPENLRFLARRLAGAPRLTLVGVEEADHFLPWDRPALLRRALGRLVRDVEAGGG